MTLSVFKDQPAEYPCLRLLSFGVFGRSRAPAFITHFGTQSPAAPDASLRTSNDRAIDMPVIFFGQVRNPADHVAELRFLKLTDRPPVHAGHTLRAADLDCLVQFK